MASSAARPRTLLALSGWFLSGTCSCPLAFVRGDGSCTGPDEVEGFEEESLVLLQHKFGLTARSSTGGAGSLRASQRSSSRSSHLSSDEDGWGFDLTDMNISTKPGNNFYDYINGEWLAETQIPSDEADWNTFDVLGKTVEHQVNDLLSGAPAGSLMNSLYVSYMNESRVNELDIAPIQPLLRQIQLIEDLEGFAAFSGATHYGFGSSPFSFGIYEDPKQPDIYVAQLSQGGLGLPDRDYYLEDNYALYREAYQKYIAQMLDMVKWDDPEGSATAVMAFEKSIAQISWSSSRMRDPVKTYNKMTPSELAKKAPGFPWADYFRAAGDIPTDTTLIVAAYSEGVDSEGVPGMAKIINNTGISVLRAWSAFHLVGGAASFLSERFDHAHFEFAGKTMSGQEVQSARWKRAVSTANYLISDIIGKSFVEKHFPSDAKAQMVDLTTLLKEAFELRLQKVTWMTESTKAKALTKLASFRFEIGEPKKFLKYEGLVFSADDLFGNVGRGIDWSWRYQLSRLGQKVDSDYWDSASPQEVNAFFDPTKNRCVFMAAILQPPFFDPKADMALNFGAMGAVIGHEMTHGFDDSGRRFDETGKLEDWWTPADAEQFNKRAQAYGAQFANFTLDMPQGFHINPNLTMGENIADLGGVNIALDAFHMWAERNGYEPERPFLMPNDDGLEGDRRFFASWDRVWRALFRRSALLTRLTTDPHSPGMARGTVPVQNVDAWYAAFHVQPGDTLFLEEANRVKIW